MEHVDKSNVRQNMYKVMLSSHSVITREIPLLVRKLLIQTTMKGKKVLMDKMKRTSLGRSERGGGQPETKAGRKV